MYKDRESEGGRRRKRTDRRGKSKGRKGYERERERGKRMDKARDKGKDETIEGWKIKRGKMEDG